MFDNREFRIYKPKGKTDGSALKLQFRVKPREGKSFDEPMLFLEIAKQLGVDENENAKFDWMQSQEFGGNSVTMKIGIPDVSELMLVLEGKKNQVGPPPKDGQRAGMGLFHQNKNGNTVLKFAKTGSGYAAQLSTSKDHSFRISLTDGEGIILRLLLEEFVRQYYSWIAIPVSQFTE